MPAFYAPVNNPSDLRPEERCLDPIGYRLPLGENPYNSENPNQHQPYLAYERCQSLEIRGEHLANDLKMLKRIKGWKLKDRLRGGIHGRILGYVLIESISPLTRSTAAGMINKCEGDEDLIKLAELVFAFFITICQFILFLPYSLLWISSSKYV